MLNLHQLTHSKAKLSIKNLNHYGSNDIARSYQRRHRVDGMAMAGRLLPTDKF